MDVEDIAQELGRTDMDELRALRGKVGDELARELIPLAVRRAIVSLREAAADLRGAPVGAADADVFEQYACEVEDIVGRVAATAAAGPSAGS